MNPTIPCSAPGTCEGCAGECLVSCFNDAIVFGKEEGYQVIEDHCAGCGACLPACEQGLISLQAGVAFIAAISWAA